MLTATQLAIFADELERSTRMRPSAQQSILTSLELGEELLWSGRPDPLRIARARIPSALAGLAVIAALPAAPVPFAFASLFSHSAGGGSTAWPLSAAVLLIGLYLLLSPVRGYRSALRTIYAVTDRRLLSLRRHSFGTSIWSARLETIEVPVLKLRSDRTGDIFFPPKAFATGIDAYAAGLAHFLGVAEAREVHGLIMRALSSERARTEAEPVRDYLDLLLRGQRSLDEGRREI